MNKKRIFLIALAATTFSAQTSVWCTNIGYTKATINHLSEKPKMYFVKAFLGATGTVIFAAQVLNGLSSLLKRKKSETMFESAKSKVLNFFDEEESWGDVFSKIFNYVFFALISFVALTEVREDFKAICELSSEETSSDEFIADNASNHSN